MSDPVTPMGGARFEGLVTVEERPRRGMITLRGDLSSSEFAAALEDFAAMPEQRQIVAADDRALAWMAPDELLLMLPPDAVAGTLARLATALSGTHHLAAEVTDARALFSVNGADGAARDVLAKLCPVDFAPGAFPQGTFRRSRLAQVPAAIWCDAPGSFGVMCFRSVAAYTFAALSTAAKHSGDVNYHP